MRNLTNACSVGAKASSAHSSKRYARKGAVLAGAIAATLAGGSSAWAQCTPAGGIVVLTPNGIFDASAIAGSGVAAVNSLVSVFNTMNTAFLTQSTAFVGAPGNAPADTNGGGVWTRGIGGQIENKSTGTVDGYTFGGVPVGLPTVTCQTTTRQEFGGYQVGADIARLNLGATGANIHFGVTAGYAESRATDVSTGGTFTGRFQVPFVGLYAAYTYGGLFLDGQVRWDFYQNSASDPASGLIDQRFDARGTSVTGNIGYNLPLGNGWFVEPSTGVVYSNVQIDPISFGLGGGNVFVVAPTTIKINDVESILGRASLRVGYNFQTGGLALQPFFTASVFHEFADNVQTSLATCFGAIFGTGVCGSVPEFAANLSTTRVGTYGQFALGIAGQIIDTGWLGYVRADYRTGEKIEGWSVNGGIRYQFTPDPVIGRAGGIYKAPVKAPVVGFAAPVNWSGFYLGANVGSLWGFSRWENIDGTGQQTNPKTAGFLGGGQVGFNYQFGNWVAGIEADADGSTSNGAAACPNAIFTTCRTQVHWTGTLAGRLGYAWDRTLFYVKGGGAWTEATFDFTFNPTNVVLGTVNDSRTGWMVGGGFEYALNANWSAKAEYNFMDFGTRNLTLSNGEFADFRLEAHAVKIGVNYRFGWAPASVVASY